MKYRAISVLVGLSLVFAVARPTGVLSPVLAPRFEQAPPVVILPSLDGIATHYDATYNPNGVQSTWYTRAGILNYGAAGPALRRLFGGWSYKDKHLVEVTSHRTGVSVLVLVVDFCDCRGPKGDERLIDLALSVWDALKEDPSRGKIDVTVKVVEWGAR